MLNHFFSREIETTILFPYWNFLNSYISSFFGCGYFYYSFFFIFRVFILNVSICFKYWFNISDIDSDCYQITFLRNSLFLRDFFLSTSLKDSVRKFPYIKVIIVQVHFLFSLNVEMNYVNILYTEDIYYFGVYNQYLIFF